MSGIIESCLLWPPMLTKNRDDPDGTLNLVVRLILPVAHTIKFKKKPERVIVWLARMCVCVLRSKAQLDQIILASPKNYKLKHFCLSFTRRTQNQKAPQLRPSSRPPVISSNNQLYKFICLQSVFLLRYLQLCQI